MLISSKNTFTETSRMFYKMSGLCGPAMLRHKINYHIISLPTALHALLDDSSKVLPIDSPTIFWTLLQNSLLQTCPSLCDFKFIMTQIQLYFSLPVHPSPPFLVLKVIVNSTCIRLVMQTSNLRGYLTVLSLPLLPSPLPKEMFYLQQCLQKRY